MSEPTKEQIEEAREFYRHAADGVVLNAPEGATLETINNEVYRRMALRLAAIRAQATNDTLDAVRQCEKRSGVCVMVHSILRSDQPDLCNAENCESIRAMKVPT